MLELGCGTGLDLAQLATRFECTGIDVQPGMVEYACDIFNYPVAVTDSVAGPPPFVAARYTG